MSDYNFNYDHPAAHAVSNTNSGPLGPLCPDGQEYYRCSIGPFTGCCASNPCDTGVCCDDDSQSSSTSRHIAVSTEADGGLPPGTTMVTRTSVVDTLTVTRTLESVSGGVGGTHATGTGDTTSKIGGSGSGSMSMDMSDMTTTTTKTDAHITGTSGHTATVTGFHTSTSPSPSSNSKLPSHHTSAAGIGIGIAAVLGLLALLLLYCCWRRKKSSSSSPGLSVNFNRNKTTMQAQEPTPEQRAAQRALQERVMVQAERERALRSLEGRGFGRGTRDGPSGGVLGPSKVWY